MSQLMFLIQRHAPVVRVGATPREVLTSADCGNSAVTQTVLQELGMSDMAAFAVATGLKEADPELCIALGLAGQYLHSGMETAKAIAKAKADAPAETKKFLGSGGYAEVAPGTLVSKNTIKAGAYGVAGLLFALALATVIRSSVGA